MSEFKDLAIAAFWALWPTIFFALGFALLAALVACKLFIFSGSGLKRRKIARLGSRPALSPTEFYQNFYAESGLSQSSVIEILDHVTNCTGIPIELLRPQDRLQVELAPIKFWELGFNFLELKMALHQAEEKAGRILDYRYIRTLDDYIRVLGQLRESGIVSSSIIYPHKVSDLRSLLVLMAILLGSLTVSFGLWELFDRWGLSRFDWLPILVFMLGVIARRWWAKRVNRRFEFGNRSDVSS